VTTPASAAVVNDHISKLSITIGDATNWDQGLALSPADGTAVFGDEQYRYHQGEKVDLGEKIVMLPDGCELSESGDAGEHTLAAGLNTFEITNTVKCETTEPGPEPSPEPVAYGELTLLKKISNPFSGIKTVPLTSWMLAAYDARNGKAVFHGRTG
jgi:hypothetical protein